MNRRLHTPKIKKAWADLKLSGDKLFEIRFNDKGYQKGDYVKYQAVTDDTGSYCSHEINNKVFEITCVVNFQQKDGWVVYGEIEVIEDDQ